MLNPYSPEFQTQMLAELDKLSRGLSDLATVLDIATGQVARREAEAAKLRDEMGATAAPAAASAAPNQNGFVSDVRAVLEALKAGVRPAADRLHRIDAHLQGSCAS